MSLAESIDIDKESERGRETNQSKTLASNKLLDRQERNYDVAHSTALAAWDELRGAHKLTRLWKARDQSTSSQATQDNAKET